MSNGLNPNKRILLNHAYWIGYTLESGYRRKAPHSKQIRQMVLTQREILQVHAYWIGYTVELGHRRKVGSGGSLLKTAVRLILWQPTHWDHLRKILDADEAPPPVATAWWSWNKGLNNWVASTTSTGLSALQSISEKWNVSDQKRQKCIA